MDEDKELPAPEAARDRRRDRASGAKAREGMRTGLAKQFKQVLDAQLRRAREEPPARPKQKGKLRDGAR
jgi:hypothetical protein